MACRSAGASRSTSGVGFATRSVAQRHEQAQRTLGVKDAFTASYSIAAGYGCTLCSARSRGADYRALARWLAAARAPHAAPRARAPLQLPLLMASIFITMDILFFWNCGAFVVDLRPRAAVLPDRAVTSPRSRVCFACDLASHGAPLLFAYQWKGQGVRGCG